MTEPPLSTIKKIERVNYFLRKAKRVVTVLILIAAAWITVDVYRKRGSAPAPQPTTPDVSPSGPTTNPASSGN